MKRMDQLLHHSIYLIRETYANFHRPALLWSMGKDSTVLLSLCRKAFLGRVPFPVLHIDTGRKFKRMYQYRDSWAKKWDLNLNIVGNNTARELSISDKVTCCTRLKTEPLKETLQQNGYDAVLLAIRRDEHGIRAKERQFSPRGHDFSWDYENQPPELWDLFESRVDTGSHIRVHPVLAWTEMDIWQYIKQENLPIIDLYFAKNGKRYRSIGCECCCQPIDSDASSVDQIIEELKCTRISERQGRAQDKEAAYAMQKLRALGYM